MKKPRKRLFKVQYDELKPRMAADRARGLTWGQIELKYGIEKSNVAKLVKKYIGARNDSM